MPCPTCVCRMQQLERMSEMLRCFEMLLKGCQCLFEALGIRASAWYQVSHPAPTAKVSAAGSRTLSRAGISSRDKDTGCGLCASKGPPEVHSFLPCASCRTAFSSAF